MRIKYYALLLILPSLFQSTSFAKEEVVSGIKSVENPAQSSEENSIKKILERVPAAKDQYNKCIKKYTDASENLSNCLWNGDNDQIEPLKKDDKDLIKNIFSKEATVKPIITPGSRTPANSTSGVDLTLKSKQLAIDSSTDPVIDKLKEVFQKKLNEALYGDDKDQNKSKNRVDHKMFNDLYKTELGKTIVDAFTSYCLDVDFANYGFDLNQMPHESGNTSKFYFYLAKKTEQSANRAKNIDQLKNSGLDPSNGSLWSQCIVSLQNVCYAKENLALVKTVNNVDQPLTLSTIKDSQNRACIIIDYVKSARKNLTIVEQTDEMYKDLDKNNKKNNVGMMNATTTTTKKNLDDIVAVTTKDIKDGYDKQTQSLVKDMEKCVDEQGNVVDPKYCKKFINTNTEELNEKFAEYSFRQFAQEDTLNDKLGSSKQEVEKYLQEEGYTKEKAQEMVKDQATLDDLKSEIALRYKREREALIADMAQKIESKTTKKDNIVDVNNDKGSLDSIKRDFASRPDDLKQLVFFNNVVSSFLSTCKTDNSTGKCQANSTSRNVASLNQELENSALLNQNELKNLNESASKQGLKKTNKDSSTTFDIKRINELLKYSSEKQP